MAWAHIRMVPRAAILAQRLLKRALGRGRLHSNAQVTPWPKRSLGLVPQSNLVWLGAGLDRFEELCTDPTRPDHRVNPAVYA